MYMSAGVRIAFGALALILTPIILFLLFTLFVVMPVSLATNAECLRNGYPKSEVTIGLERYCMNLNGTVTVKVEKISK